MKRYVICASLILASGCVRTTFQHSADSTPGEDVFVDGTPADGADAADSTSFDSTSYPSPNEAGAWTTAVRLAPEVEGDGFVMVYSEFGPGSPEADLRLVSIGPDGTLGTPRTISSPSERPRWLALLALGDHYLLAYVTDRLYVVILQANGTASGEKNPAGEHDDIERVKLFATTTGAGLLYDRREPINRRLMMRQLDTTGDAVGEELLVDADNHWQIAGDAVWAGDHPLIVWHDYRKGSGKPRVRICTGPGEPSREIESSAKNQHSPLITAGAQGEYLVVWDEELAQRGTVINGEAKQVSSRTFELAAANRHESVDKASVGNSSGYVLAWQSDLDGVLPQLRYRFIEAERGLLLPLVPAALADRSAEHHDVTMVLADQRLAMAWIGVSDGAWRAYVRVSNVQ